MDFASLGDSALQDVIEAVDDEVLRGLSEEDLARLLSILQQPPVPTADHQNLASAQEVKARAASSGAENLRQQLLAHTKRGAAIPPPPKVGMGGALLLCAAMIICIGLLAALLMQAGDPCLGREPPSANHGLKDRYEALLRDREALSHEKEALVHERDALSAELRTALLEREKAQMDAADAWQEVERLTRLLPSEVDNGVPIRKPSVGDGSSRSRVPIGQQLHIGLSGSKAFAKPTVLSHSPPDRDHCEPLLSAYHSQSEQLTQLQASLERMREAYSSANTVASCSAGPAGAQSAHTDEDRKQRRLEAELQQCRDKWNHALQVQDRVWKTLANDPKRFYGAGQ
mmetsp:Transcript_46666/g.110979  ORF Transcript_46666/g.110979 Transcript_46666/m.110979 type:complete len:343 (+) Transcript_46666:74-1102(+)